MYSLAKEPLIKVSVVSKGEKIGITNYSDLIVFDKDKTVVAIRIGGYPETVQAMSDILISGCDLELQTSLGYIRQIQGWCVLQIRGKS